MRQDWVAIATRAVPRYTSYPTAVQFHDGVRSDQVARWARSVTPGAPVSVYAHIPFCEKLCWYCGCHTTVPNGYDRIARYVTTLHREIEVWAGMLGPHGGAGHLHFGGGSPNALSADDFFAVAEHLRTAFRLRDDAEVSVELDPRSMTPEKVQSMAAAGVTRASLGVQTLAEDVQKAVNRIQPREMIVQTVADLRAVGISAINMDLMYGLPHQTLEDCVDAARFAVSQRADRLAVFGYAHVPWFARHQNAIDAEALPGLHERFAQAEAIRGVLEGAGYIAVGLDHFAKPVDPMARAAQAGTLRRNFQGYTTDPCETLIGLGLSAISAFKEGYAQNAKDVRDWREAVDGKAELAIVRGLELDADDRLRARAIEALMCTMQVDAAQVCLSMGQPEDMLDEAVEAARTLEVLGLCTVEGRLVRVPAEARSLMRTVAQCFDRHTPLETAARHAKAV